MFAQRRVPFSRFAAIAAMLGAMGFFAWTSRVSADFVGSQGTLTFVSGSPSLHGPSYSSNSTFLTESGSLPAFPSPIPPQTLPSNGFTLSGGDYTITNTNMDTNNPTLNNVQAKWTASRDFNVSGSVAIKEATVGEIDHIIVSNGAVNGNLTIMASIWEYGAEGGTNIEKVMKTALTVTLPPSGSVNPPPWTWNVAFGNGTILTTGAYFVQLETDLNFTSIANGASVEVDPMGPSYTASVDQAVPEPSSLVLFSILSTTMLAGLAGRRWQSRRRCGSDQRAAASPCG